MHRTEFTLTEDQFILLQHLLPKKYVLLKDNSASQRLNNKSLKKSHQLSFTSTQSLPLDHSSKHSKPEPSHQSAQEELQSDLKQTQSNPNPEPDEHLENKHQTLKQEREDARQKSRDLFTLLLDLIEEKKSAEIFLEPVDPIRDKIPEYLQVIKKPMDLKTMRKKINKKQYPNFDEFKKDIDQIVWNCMTFNAGNDYFLKIAAKFDQDCKAIFNKNKIQIQEQSELIEKLFKSRFKKPKMNESTSHESLPKIKRTISQAKSTKTVDSGNQNDLSPEKSAEQAQMKSIKRLKKLSKQSTKERQKTQSPEKEEAIEPLVAQKKGEISPQKEPENKKNPKILQSEKQTQKFVEKDPKTHKEDMLKLLKRIRIMPKDKKAIFCEEINLKKGEELDFKNLSQEEFHKIERKFNDFMSKRLEIEEDGGQKIAKYETPKKGSPSQKAK